MTDGRTDCRNIDFYRMKLNGGLKGNRLFLLATAFMAGYCIMSLELSASRVLAPGFGSSVYVWGALIGVIMIALSCGYYLGGRLADKRGDLGFLYKYLIYTGIWVSWIAPFGTQMAGFLSIFTGLVAGSILSTIILFVVPMTFLSMTSPAIIKVYTRNLSTVGSSAGLIYSLSTVGSIVGTFLTAFVLLPAIGTKATMLANAVILFLFGLLGAFNRWNALMCIMLIPGFINPPVDDSSMIYKAESEHNIISVYDYPEHRILKLNWEWAMQSYMNKSGIVTNMFFDVYSVGPLLTDARRILYLGMCAGTSVKQLVHFYDVEVDAVELDPQVVEVAQEYFNLSEGDGLRIHAMDGRMFLRNSGRYDIINIDVFKTAEIPFHMATVEFFSECDDHLTDDGLLIMNVITVWGDDRVGRSISNTLRQVFPSVYVTNCGGNMLVFAFKQKKTRAELVKKLDGRRNPAIQETIECLREDLYEFKPAGEYLFTDDKSNIEELSYKSQGRRRLKR
jgi:spermidine synthase